MKRAYSSESETDLVPYSGSDGFEVAKLVCIYGFCCVNNMRLLSKCLNRAFLEWARKYVFDRGAVTWSSASSVERECFHRSFIGVDLLRWEIVELRPQKWFHLYHASWNYDDADWQISSILQLAATSITSNPFALHSIAALLKKDGLAVEEVQTVQGFPHPIWVKHNHQTGHLEFHICMKWR